MAQSNGEVIHNIVIIGASFGGLPVAHTLLKDVTTSLGLHGSYKVYLISPNSQFFWRPAAPRIVVNPAAFPEDKAFFNIADGFAKYGKHRFEHVQAYATSIDPSSQTVSYKHDLEDLSSANVHYDTLVLATGTSFKNPMWSVQSGEEAAKAGLKEMQQQISAARSILIVGGGPVGTETAGELGYLHGHKKEITILSGTSRLLARLQDKRVGQDAETRLKGFGVKVIHETRYEGTQKTADKKELVKLSNGSEMTVDLVIEATGEVPCNDYVPKEWLTEDGLVRTVVPTLRADIPGVKNVYAIGSLSSALKGGILGIIFSYKALCESIRVDLTGEGDKAKRSKTYKPAAKDVQLVPIGPKQGVGTAYGFKFPSFAVTRFKSKDYMIGNAIKFVDGTGP